MQIALRVLKGFIVGLIVWILVQGALELWQDDIGATVFLVTLALLTASLLLEWREND